MLHEKVMDGKLTFGKILTNVRARLRKTQAEFIAFLELPFSRAILSHWERDRKKPYRTNMVLIKEKITPHLLPDELAALEELTS